MSFFEVIAKKGLVFPSSAEITVNPSQVQLLRTAGMQLQTHVQSLKAALARSDNQGTGNIQRTIRDAIRIALESVNDTQLEFHRLSSTGSQQQKEQIFFDDLRINYDELLHSLGGDTGSIGLDAEQLRPVSVVAATSRDGLSDNVIIQAAALRPFEQNEAAYEVVADTQSLIFDLTVKSTPPGAAICYHRRGDNCRSNPDPTNTVITSLVYAIWMVQFHKPGYESEEIEHDPFREPNHLIDIDLRPRGKSHGRK
jgi:hypothetical protein